MALIFLPLITALASCSLIPTQAYAESWQIPPRGLLSDRRNLGQGRKDEKRTHSRKLASNCANGKFECSSMNGTTGAGVCVYGHTAANDNCDKPCEGVRRAPCRCYTEDEAADGHQSKANLAMGISAAIVVSGIALVLWSAQKNRQSLNMQRHRRQACTGTEEAGTVVGSVSSDQLSPAMVQGAVVQGTVVGAASAGGAPVASASWGIAASPSWPAEEAIIPAAGSSRNVQSPQTNDEGAAVSFGNAKFASIEGMDGSGKYYCTRRLGYDVLGEDSDGVCGKMGGPYGGPQCPSCERLQVASASDSNGEDNPQTEGPESPLREESRQSNDSPQSPPIALVEINSHWSTPTAAGAPVQQPGRQFKVIHLVVPLVFISFMGYFFIANFTQENKFYDSYYSFMTTVATGGIMIMVLGTFGVSFLARSKESGSNHNPVLLLRLSLLKIKYLVPIVGVIGFLWGLLKSVNPSGYHAECGEWTPRL